MSDLERLDERLTAVEQTVVDGEYQLDELEDLAETLDELDRLEERLDDIEDRLADLESRSQAIEGFVGNVRSVNEEVERQADTALAVVERLEERLEVLESQANVDPGSPQQRQGPRNGPQGRVDSIFAAAESPASATNGGTNDRAQTQQSVDVETHYQPDRLSSNSSQPADTDAEVAEDADQETVEKNFTPSDADDESPGPLTRVKSWLT